MVEQNNLRNMCTTSSCYHPETLLFRYCTCVFILHSYGLNLSTCDDKVLFRSKFHFNSICTDRNGTWSLNLSSYENEIGYQGTCASML